VTDEVLYGCKVFYAPLSNYHRTDTELYTELARNYSVPVEFTPMSLSGCLVPLLFRIFYFVKLAKNDANPKTGRANIKTCKPLTTAGEEITNGKI